MFHLYFSLLFFCMCALSLTQTQFISLAFAMRNRKKNYKLISHRFVLFLKKIVDFT